MDRQGLDTGDTVEVKDGVILTQLTVGDRMSIQHLRLEPGGRVPKHNHPHEQVGFVYQGTETFLIDGDRYDVHAGESYTIPSNEPHAAENRGTEPAELIDIFSPPRPDPDWLE